MFTNIRKSAKSFFAKLILLFLIAMFGLWGIGDVFKGMGGNNGNVATVGGTPITMQQYRFALQRLSGQQEQSLQALMGLIEDLLIQKDANALGITISDDTVADFLNNLPQFHGKDGRFDKAIYRQTLEARGKSEEELVENVRTRISGRLLIGSLIGDLQVPEEVVLAQYRENEERRAASIVLITPARVATGTQKPSEEEIKAYYEAHKKDYTAPEVRALSYVALPIADVQAKIEASEEEIKRVYEERKEEFHTPERLLVDDMAFANQQDADEAAKALAKGKTLAQVLASAPLDNKGKTSLGYVEKQELPLEAQDKVFALKQDGFTVPILAKFRWHIYHAGKIEPPRLQTMQEARATIVREIVSQQAQETGQKMMNGFQDALAGGDTLEQAAEKIGQKVHTAGPVSRAGNAPDGKKADLPPYDNFLTVAFATGEKDHSQVAQARDGSYFLVRVDSVSPEHLRPLGEVKEQVAGAAMAAKVHAKLSEVAQDVSAKMRAGKPVADAPPAAAAGNLTRGSEIVTEGPLTGNRLPGPLMSELFHIAPNQSTHAYPTEDGNYMIATLGAITKAPLKPDPALLDGIRDRLKETLKDETLHRYMAYLRGKFPVTYNNSALGIAKDEEHAE